MLDEPSAKALLAGFGIASPGRRVLAGEQDLAALEGLAGPFVLKAVSPQIVHKSDVGAVRLGLADAAAVGPAIAAMRASLAAQGYAVPQWLVEQMAPAGVECVVGGLHDAEFGPMVMVGLGGIFVEVLKDVAFRICPIERIDAIEMLDELKGKALLDGARGQAAVSREAIIATLLKIGGESGLLMSLGNEIAEADINPLIVSTNGAVAVDARFILTREGAQA